MKRGKASVVWELVDVGGAQRLVVDVDAPLRPFGTDPTPPRGVRALDDFDELTPADLMVDAEEAPAPPSPPRPTTDELLKALRARSTRRER